MQGIDFPEANVGLQAPEGREHDVNPLRVLRAKLGTSDDPIIVSCWDLTDEERKIIAGGGRVFLVLMGNSMPPAMMKVGIDLGHAFPQTPV